MLREGTVRGDEVLGPSANLVPPLFEAVGPSLRRRNWGRAATTGRRGALLGWPWQAVMGFPLPRAMLSVANTTTSGCRLELRVRFGSTSQNRTGIASV